MAAKLLEEADEAERLRSASEARAMPEATFLQIDEIRIGFDSLSILRFLTTKLP